MTKLYDYSILILMEEKRNFVDQDGTEDIFAAVVEVCLKFRQFQEEGQVLCFTWSAVSMAQSYYQSIYTYLLVSLYSNFELASCFSI